MGYSTNRPFVKVDVTGEVDKRFGEVTSQLEDIVEQDIKLRAVKLVAHRGFNLLAPENSMPAYEWAVKLGMKNIELDIQLTSDDVWKVMHDETVDRTTDGTGLLGSKTSAEIDALTIDAGNNIEMYSNLKVPNLEDILKLCVEHGLTPNIEVKPGENPEKLPLLIDLLKKYNMVNSVLLSSFNTEILNKLRGLDGSIYLMYIISPSPTQTHINTAKGIGKCGIVSNYANTGKAQVELMLNEGIKIAVYTVDAVDKLREFVDYGVDYIMSNNFNEVI